MFNRFDICEAWYLLACDHGLYGIIDRLEKMTFMPSPLLRYDNMTRNGKEIYQGGIETAKKTGPYSRKLGE